MKEYYRVEKSGEKFSLKNCRILSDKDVKVDDRVRAVSGKKIPLLKEGRVVRIFPNKYGRGPGNNPSLLIKLDDGTESWTTGRNVINLEHTGEEGIKEFDNEIDALFYIQKLNAWKRIFLNVDKRNQKKIAQV